MPEAAANQLTEIFSGDIDFHHDLRKGDKFTVVYEMTYSGGAGQYRPHPIRRIHQSRPVYRAIYFQKDITAEGKSVRKAFLRSPIEYSRVSSGFTNSRFHPLLNQWRSHKGVDFAAPTGTRVKATADGVVALIGNENGYGNLVKIRHQDRYTTVYGHLSRFAQGLHRGQRVAQGDVIAYVGMTGMTSVHHYEFKISGQHHNPMRVALPDAQPIGSSYREAFQSVADDFVARLNLLRNTNLANLD
jgi:murein DD-endopeptidase MepM/ murein hydrolase activator NlpD